MDGSHTSISSRSPAIHKAPPEIIIAIIEILLSSSKTLPLGRKYQDLVRFTHVSSQLRNIAITTPSLWTGIEITDRPASFELAKACLQRSGSQKLDINICLVVRIGARLPGILALVDYVAVRTRRLVLSLGLRKESQWRQIQDAFRPFGSPSLDHLELKFWYDDDVLMPDETPELPVPTQVPNLRSLVLTGVFPAFRSAGFDQLRNLVLSSSTYAGWPFAQLWEVLSQCRLLETLELITIPGPTASMVDNTIIPREPSRQYLPNLRLLVVKGYRPTFLSQLLLNLDAPELEEVEVGFVWDVLEFPFNWSNFSIPRPFNSVRLLSVSLQQALPHFLYAQLAQFLPRIFPNIGELSLSRNGWPVLEMFSSLMNGESDGSSSSPRWTELRGLSVADSDEQCCDGKCMERLQGVRTFLKARSGKGLPRLKWAQVISCWPVESKFGFDSTVEGIREMLDEDDGLGFLFTRDALQPCHNTYSELESTND
ncbi:hypothetical protein FRC04_001555 [Tulasnella sp. 424]|nr:hypothetical protein FRC04_001555 [Tulasnella sp. 424]KAG8969098.1 hypothetical protein FRC05_001251 [Tulasnella sp. 425]